MTKEKKKKNLFSIVNTYTYCIKRVDTLFRRMEVIKTKLAIRVAGCYKKVNIFWIIGRVANKIPKKVLIYVTIFTFIGIFRN